MLGRDAARKAVRKQLLRVAAQGTDFPHEVLASFAGHFCERDGLQKTAFVNLTRKLSQLGGAFKRLPKLWEAFKRAVGVTSLADVPAALKRLAGAAKKALRSALHKMFDTWPLKLYTLEKALH